MGSRCSRGELKTELPEFYSSYSLEEITEYKPETKTYIVCSSDYF